MLQCFCKPFYILALLFEISVIFCFVKTIVRTEQTAVKKDFCME